VKKKRGLWPAAVALVLGAGASCAQTGAAAPPASVAWTSPGARAGADNGAAAGRLLAAGDLVYQGAFKLPHGEVGSSSFAYGGSAIAFNPERGSLFIVGHDQKQQVAEIAIPAIVNSAGLWRLNTATVLQPFADVTRGRLAAINPDDPNAKKIGGLFPYKQRLIATGYSFYDGNASQRVSHFVAGQDLSGAGDVRGPFKVGAVPAGLVSGYLAAVPSAWQKALGGDVFTGQCCLAVISRTSYGPALFTMRTAQLDSQEPVDATPLLYYPKDHPLLEPGATGTGYDATSKLFNGATSVKGLVVPEGTRSVLFFGRQGLGAFCYGPGTDSKDLAGQPADGAVDRWCFDPSDASKGTHAHPYEYYVWAYDASDLAAVKNGTREPWDVLPYATWTLRLPFSEPGDARLNGAAYDPQTGRIFLSQAFGDGEFPLIHVVSVRLP
jgi:hypothetical protein